MATTDQELKKLNKTVNEAVGILKMYAGNSAQLKNMNEKQREAVDKWFDVNEDAEENQKKQRAFTERARDENGKFIKKKEAQSNKIIQQAKQTIENEKLAAITELKNQVAELSIGIAEKIMKDELSNKGKQVQLIEKMLDEAKLK